MKQLPVRVRRSHHQHIDVIALERGLAGLGSVQDNLGYAFLLFLFVHFSHPLVNQQAELLDDAVFVFVCFADAA